jgi:anti-sigma factor RsiW
MSGLEDTSMRFDSVDEELVAYLDGELDADEAAQIEGRLATDPNLRGRLQQLQRAWDMLDELPQQDVQERFTRTTMAMVVTEATDGNRQATAKWRVGRLLIGVMTIATCVVAMVVSYKVVDGILEAPNRRLRSDLPVIRDLDAFRNADSIDFLRRLAKEGLFAEEAEDAIQNAPLDSP